MLEILPRQQDVVALRIAALAAQTRGEELGLMDGGGRNRVLANNWNGYSRGKFDSHAWASSFTCLARER